LFIYDSVCCESSVFMIENFATFKIEKLNIPFVSPDGITFPRTVTVTLLNKNNEDIAYYELGYDSIYSVYQKIHENKPINLDYAYVENFSLHVYRKMFELEKHSVVNLPEFSARHAIFNARSSNNFSHAHFDNGNVDFEGAIFLNGNINFNNAVFGDGDKNFSYWQVRQADIDFSGVSFGNGEASFKNSIFLEGEKNFKDAVFGEGLINFNNVHFGDGDLLFIHTTFGDGKVQFKISEFGKGLKDFHYSNFGKGDITFEKSIFEKGVLDFSKIDFGEGRINLNRARFRCDTISFEGAELRSGRLIAKKADFGDAKISFEELEFSSSNVIFDDAKINDSEISFTEASVDTLSFAGCNLDKYIDLRVKQCVSLNLQKTTVRDIIDLIPGQSAVKIKKLNFKGMQLLGLLLVDWKQNRLYDLIVSQEDTTVEEKAEQFRTLKQNFFNTGRYDEEDYAYVWFKRYELKAKYRQHMKEKKYWYIFVFALQKLVFDKVGKYATDPVQVLFSMLVVYSSFSLTYATILFFKWGEIVSAIGGVHDQISMLGRSFFFGAITFLTIGYGDFYPMGLVRILSAMEGFIGVFLMSYFTVAFVRKILR